MKRLALLLVLCLGCTPQPQPQPQITPPPYDAGVRDGTVIFLQGGLLVRPIFHYTDSTLTHAAIVLYHGKEPWVYEATPPCVRRMPLADYRKLIAEKLQEPRLQKRNLKWFFMQPVNSYTSRHLRDMKWYAESQLGRPYMLRGWWKGREVRGIFCSQYVGNIIEQSGKIKSNQFRESPGSLHDKILPFYFELSAP
jgi:hypothetical protein